MTPSTQKGANPTMSGYLGRRGLTILLAWAVPLLLGLVFLGATPAHAQVGSITGKVTDDAGVGVPYANVILKGTQLGGRANADGKYTIIKIPVGTYTLAT